MKSLFQGIKGKLFLAAFVPMFGFAAVCYFTYTGVSYVSGMLNNAYTNELPNVEALGEVEGGRARIGQYLWGAVANLEHQKRRDIYVTKLEEALNEYKAAIKDYEDSANMAGEAEIYAPMKANHEKYVGYVTGFIADLKVPTPESYEKVRAAAAEGPYQASSVQVKQTTIKLNDLYKKQIEINNAKQKADTQQIFQWLFGISAGCAFLVFAVLYFIGTRVSTSVGSAVHKITESGSQVNLAIAQLSQAGQSLSQSSTESAASLEETVAALEEMSSMVQMNSDNAKQAASLSQNSRSSAEDGEREIKRLVDSMHGISSSSRKIEEIINVIDDIAFQTNLLALNAAVEAARAGEQGKGFAVVAEAVRTLAQRSAVAAKDITGLIKQSVQQIEEGTDMADKSGAVLNNIVTSIKKVSDLNNEIAAASSEQTTGIQQISKAMNQLDQSSQSNAASSEEIASTSEEIASQAGQMNKLIVELSDNVLGKTKSEESVVHEEQKAHAPVAKKSATKAPVKSSSSSNVVKFKTQPKSAPAATAPKVLKKTGTSSDIIPFDDDEGDDRKVGTTDGF
ncbi:methyl-accepting chemotaxis protein [Bdellovibrio sp. HCB209]|uniref:methyl-accepting chemotaxis protein n=1 Tax=Bdellovibrio sp. HCB209 TaxID=3394354 RepID=UPI0039B3D893